MFSPPCHYSVENTIFWAVLKYLRELPMFVLARPQISNMGYKPSWSKHSCVNLRILSVPERQYCTAMCFSSLLWINHSAFESSLLRRKYRYFRLHSEVIRSLPCLWPVLRTTQIPNHIAFEQPISCCLKRWRIRFHVCIFLIGYNILSSCVDVSIFWSSLFQKSIVALTHASLFFVQKSTAGINIGSLSLVSCKNRYFWFCSNREVLDPCLCWLILQTTLMIHVLLSSSSII